MNSYYREVICYITKYINNRLSKCTQFKMYSSEFQSYELKLSALNHLINWDEPYVRINQDKDLHVRYALDEGLHSNEEFVSLYYNYDLENYFEAVAIDTFDKSVVFVIKATDEIMGILTRGDLRREDTVEKEPEIPQININLYML